MVAKLLLSAASDVTFLEPELAEIHRRLEAAAARLAIAGARDLRDVLVQAQEQEAQTVAAADLLNQVQEASQSAAQGAQRVAASSQQVAAAAETGAAAMQGSGRPRRLRWPRWLGRRLKWPVSWRPLPALKKW